MRIAIGSDHAGFALKETLKRWLTEQGHTVFILSWKNPDEGDADLGMDDYLRLGVLDSLARIAELVPGEPVHACGYCLGEIGRAHV